MKVSFKAADVQHAMQIVADYLEKQAKREDNAINRQKTIKETRFHECRKSGLMEASHFLRNCKVEIGS